MSYYVKNVDSLIKKLENISKVATDEALETACAMVERDAKILCPVGMGELRNSITYEVEDGVGAVGSNLEYAPYVHQGTGIYAIHGDGRKDRWSYQDAEGNWHSTIGQQPNPFLQRALDMNQEAITKMIQQKVREAANG
jgi:HK97 gp10 family phage protein